MWNWRQAAALLVLALPLSSVAHKETGPSPIPAAEQTRAQQLQAQGPQQNQGVLSVTALGAVALDGEFAGAEGRQLRAREILIAPGGRVAVHQHDQRPGVAYILEGEATEHRNDRAEPVVHGPGSVAFEKTGVIHWWENTGTVPMRAVVVDIVAAPAP